MPKRTLLMSDGPHFEPGYNIYKAELTELVMFGGDMLIFGDDVVWFLLATIFLDASIQIRSHREMSGLFHVSEKLSLHEVGRLRDQ